MSSPIPSIFHLQLNQYQLQLAQPNGAGSSSRSSSQTIIDKCVVYIVTENDLNSDVLQVTNHLQRLHVAVDQNSFSSASHFVLFITDSLLKSKKLLLPLITRFKADPHFQQRLFPIMDSSLSIFKAGTEHPYIQYWTDQLANTTQKTEEYREIKLIEENITSFIRALRDTCMPPLNELIQSNMSPMIEAIEKRSHLLVKKRFFFLPNDNISNIIGREAALLQLSTLFADRPVVTLSGEEGIGKTSLAVEYAKRSQQYSSGIFWLDGSNFEALKSCFQNLAIQLGLKRKEVERELSEMSNFLLIYDNVSDISLIPSFPSGHSLIIGSDLQNANIRLECFTAEDTARYLQEQLNASSQESETLGDLLKNNPAKLTQAITFIKRLKITIQNYIDYYLNDQKNLEVKQAKLLHPTPVTSTQIDHQQSQNYQSTVSLNLNKYQSRSVNELLQKLKEQEIQIFLSYSWSPSKLPADQIDSFFTSNNCTLIRDKRELRNFASVREFMKKAVRNADYTFCLVNRNYLLSLNCIFELVTFMKDPAWKKRVFPIVLPGTNLDDQALAEYEEHWKKEAKNLERSQGRSAPEAAIALEAAGKIGAFIRFVNQVGKAPLDALLQAEFKETIALMLERQDILMKKGAFRQKILHLPQGRNQDFVGREKEIQLLADSLKKGVYSAITNIGMGGVGKSQLALQYAYNNEQEYRMIYWIRSENMESIKSDYRMLGQEMGIAEEFLNDDNIISTMKGVIENQEEWLLIFDNAEDPKIISEALPQKGGHIIITSRNPNWDNKVSLDVFSKTDAFKFLKKISGVEQQEADLNTLSEELGYLPLALSQAGAYIRRQNINVADYLALYRENQRQLLLTHQERNYPCSVASAWQLSMEKITQENSNAFQLLNFCSYLAPDKIPQAVLEAWLKESNQQMTSLDLHDALGVLENYSIITQNVEKNEGTQKKTISLHRLIQTITRERNSQANATIVMNKGIEIFNRQFKGNVETATERQNGELLVHQAEALLSHAGKQGLENTDTASLTKEIGTFYWKTGELNRANVLLEKALQVFIKHYGKEHKSVAECYQVLGNMHSELDENHALEMFKEALAIFNKLYPKETHESQAECYIGMDNVGQSTSPTHFVIHHGKALQIFKRYYGTEAHPNVANCYLIFDPEINSSPFMYSPTINSCEKALRIMRDYYKTDAHMNVAKVYETLMALQTDPLKMKELFKITLEIKKACLGTERHMSVAASYRNLGQALEKLACNFEKMNEQLLRGRWRTCHHPWPVPLDTTTKEVLVEIKELYEKALMIDIDCFGNVMNGRMAKQYFKIGEIAFKLRDLNEAKILCENAQSIVITSLETHISDLLKRGMPENKQGYQLFGDAIEGHLLLEKILTCLKEHKEAKEVLQDALALVENRKSYCEGMEVIAANEGCKVLYFGNIYNRLSENSQLLGNLEDAIEFKNLELMALKEDKINLNKRYNLEGTGDLLSNTGIEMCYGELGELYKKINNFLKAKEMFEKELNLVMTSKLHLLYLPLKYKNLGDLCMELKQFSEAREYYSKAKNSKTT